MIQWILAIWSLVPLPFLKPAWTSGSFQFTYCWSLAWRILSITLLACEVNYIPENSSCWEYGVKMYILRTWEEWGPLITKVQFSSQFLSRTSSNTLLSWPALTILQVTPSCTVPWEVSKGLGASLEQRWFVQWLSGYTGGRYHSNDTGTCNIHVDFQNK